MPHPYFRPYTSADVIGCEMGGAVKNVIAHSATLAGLAGLGDLVATSTSPLSRKRTLGTHPGHGLAVDQAAAATRQTTEGVKSAGAIVGLARTHEVDMPITAIISALLHEKITPDEAADALMQRPPKPEH